MCTQGWRPEPRRSRHTRQQFRARRANPGKLSLHARFQRPPWRQPSPAHSPGDFGARPLLQVSVRICQLTYKRPPFASTNCCTRLAFSHQKHSKRFSDHTTALIRNYTGFSHHNAPSTAGHSPARPQRFLRRREQSPRQDRTPGPPAPDTWRGAAARG